MFPQSFPLLAAIATKNLLAAAVATEDEEEKDDLRFSQAWSAGNLCFKQILIWQVLQLAVFENVRTSLHRRTGHLGFFFFFGSQSPDFSCLSRIFFSSSPSCPVVSIAVEQISQTETFRLSTSDFGHSCDLYDRCSKQKTCREKEGKQREIASICVLQFLFNQSDRIRRERKKEGMRESTLLQALQLNGKKSSCRQSECWQWLPSSGKASVPPPIFSLIWILWISYQKIWLIDILKLDWIVTKLVCFIYRNCLEGKPKFEVPLLY